MKISQEKTTLRRRVYDFFVQTARQENAKNQSIDIGDLFDKNGNKRGLILIQCSGGDIFLITSLFKSFHESNPNFDLYIVCDPKFNDILEGNPYVHKILPYNDVFQNELLMRNYVDYYCHVAISTQKILNYLVNKSPALDLQYKEPCI